MIQARHAPATREALLSFSRCGVLSLSLSRTLHPITELSGGTATAVAWIHARPDPRCVCVCGASVSRTEWTHDTVATGHWPTASLANSTLPHLALAGTFPIEPCLIAKAHIHTHSENPSEPPNTHTVAIE